MSTKLVSLSLIALLSITQLTGQSPQLSVGDKKGNSEVYLKSLDVDVNVVGNIATTKFTMTFKNKTSKILEGELLFPLPEGVTVSHYALDINGKLREAVPVEKAKATQVFEEIEQRRVDPGLLERVEGNNFRTRIYPFPANGERTIAIGYEQELTAENGQLHYRLPMDYKQAIDEFSLKALVLQSNDKPAVDKQLSGELNFDKQGTSYVSSFKRKNYIPSRLLSFSLPAPVDIPQVYMQPASGSYYFMASCYPKVDSRKKEWSEKLAIIWDASLSGEQRDVKRELEVLDAIINAKKGMTINVYFLNNALAKNGTYTTKNGNWTLLREALENVQYDGGTSYSAIDLLKVEGDEILLFSDGLSTLSDADFIGSNTGLLQREHTNRPIHCVVSSPKADYSALKWIAAQTNGKFINLNSLSQADAQKELMYESLHYLGIRKPNSVSEVFPSVSTPVYGNFSITGILDGNEAEIILQFGYGTKVSIEKKVKLKASEANKDLAIHRIWAQKKINELDMQFEKNKDELTELGQQFGVVTRNTSLIVLETLQDYITYQITPPAELLAEYNRWKTNRDAQVERERQNMLNVAKSSMTVLKKWWEKEYKVVKPKYPKPDKLGDGVADEILPVVEEESIELQEIVVTAFGSVTRNDRRRETASARSVVSEDIAQAEQRSPAASLQGVASGVTISESKDMLMDSADKQKEIILQSLQSQPTIKLKALKQDSEYMKGLTGDVKNDYKKYLEMRPVYGGTPTFFFDMADWFFHHNDKEKALRVLSSIADMDLENASLYRLLGYRFKEYGEYQLETYVCKKVVQWRPMEPQSYRDYALALADAGKYQEALNELYATLKQSYANNISARSAGIEEVTVTELNQLIGLYGKKLNVDAIDKELIANLPVDVRVVINWNMNSTDIDLHLTDPNKETCYYSHRETAIGGRISNDITQGYGPEQFMLKKAIKGKYKVYVNYFGDSQVKAEGPSTILVEIYTNYGKSNQQRKVCCVQLSKERRASSNGLLEVAEFEF